ncbi:hypothetical protein E4T56_gene8649, partial [Termitomyces sp. T112]
HPDAPDVLAVSSAAQQADASCFAGPPQHPDAAPAASTPPREQTPFSRDRADLLLTGHHEEGRRAAIGLHAGEIEARLVMGELACTVRTHRAAAVLVGIDQRRESDRRLDRRIEPQTQLGQEREVGAE